MSARPDRGTGLPPDFLPRPDTELGRSSLSCSEGGKGGRAAAVKARAGAEPGNELLQCCDGVGMALRCAARKAGAGGASSAGLTPCELPAVELGASGFFFFGASLLSPSDGHEVSTSGAAVASTCGRAARLISGCDGLLRRGRRGDGAT